VSGSTSDASASEPAAPSSGSLRSFLREYWSSATRPSLAVLLVVLATTLGIFGAATIGLTQETMAHGAHAFLANVDSDHAAFATGRALKLGLSSSRDLRVVVVGASSTREAMDADDLERTVLEHAGVRVRVDNLATGSQFLVESMALSERIPDGARGVLLIGVGSVRFSAPPESLAVYAEAPRLGIRSDQLDALYREAGIDAPPRTGVYAYDNLAYLAPRFEFLVLRLALRRPARQIPHGYLGLPQTKPDGRIWRAARKRLVGYDAHREHNRDLLRNLVRHVRSRTGMKVMLVRPPVNPRFNSGLEDRTLPGRHHRFMREVAAELDAPFLSLPEIAPCTEDEFWDWCHLRSREAIRRCSEAVGIRMVPLLVPDRDPEESR
jgi:hypothetical protein